MTSRLSAQGVLAGAEDLCTQLFRRAPVSLLVHDPDGNLIAASDQAVERIQLDADKLQDLNICDLFATEEADHLRREWAVVSRGKRLTDEGMLLKQRSRTPVRVEIHAQRLSDERPEIIITSLQNLSRAEAAEKKLEDQLRFLQDFFDTIPCPAFYKNREGIYLGCNNAFAQQIIGIPASELIGHSLFDLPEIIPHELAQVYYEADQKLFNSGGQQIYETKVQCADGVRRDFLFSKSTFTDARGEIAGLCGVMIDLSQKVAAEEALRAANRELARLSQMDPLTGIANRRHFDATLADQWLWLQRQSKPLSLIMLDVDHFKAYNDCYGHPAGDEALQQVAQTLATSAVREQDLVARLGGEEFAVLLPGADSGAARAVAERIHQRLAALAIPHRDNPDSPLLTVSIGCATALPDAENQPSQLVAAADAALYLSKREGRNRITVAQS